MLILSSNPSLCIQLTFTKTSASTSTSTRVRAAVNYKYNVIKSMAKDQEDSKTNTNGVVIAGGLISNPVIGWSLYTLKTTGCGLPPGPGGSIGAIEGVSYLIVVGILGWSLYKKAKTGSGLPNGPYGLLGAVEGVSYLSFLAILLVFGLHFIERGYIPGPLPAAQCFG